jgi:hypothetical protein
MSVSGEVHTSSKKFRMVFFNLPQQCYHTKQGGAPPPLQGRLLS